MKNLLRSEIYRLTKNKGIIVTSILALALSIFVPFFLTVGLAIIESIMNVDSLHYYGFDQFCSTLSGGSLVSIILLFVLTSYSTDDFKYRTIQNKIISGYNRKQIFFTKLIINVSIGVIINIVYSLFTLLFSSLFLGFSNSSTFVFADFLNILGLLASYILIQITTYTLLTVINISKQKNNKTLVWFIVINIIISIGISISITLLEVLELQGWIVLIQDLDPNTQLVYLANNELNPDLFILIIISNIIYTFIIGLIGYNSFKNKELK